VAVFATPKLLWRAAVLVERRAVCGRRGGVVDGGGHGFQFAGAGERDKNDGGKNSDRVGREQGQAVARVCAKNLAVDSVATAGVTQQKDAATPYEVGGEHLMTRHHEEEEDFQLLLLNLTHLLVVSLR